MAFWDGLVKGIQSFFGGGNSQKKKMDEEEQRRQRAVSSAAPKPNSLNSPNSPNSPNFRSNNQQGSNQLKVQQPKPMFGTLNNSISQDPFKLKTPTVKPIKNAKQQELDELYKANLDKVREEIKRQSEASAPKDFFGKFLRWTGADGSREYAENRAKILARSRASAQYQDKHGWNADPEVLKFNQKTTDMGNETWKKIRTQNDNLNKFSKGMDKAAQAIQHVPVVGSVFNAGLAANEQIAKRTGADLFGNNAETVRGMRNKVDFGMTNQEFDALDEETKGKLRNIQNIGLALTPLDFLGLGGLAKSGVGNLTKRAVTSAVKREALDEATKAGFKTLAKNSVKTALPATAVGTGIGAGAQAYLTGEVDPLEALKGGLMVGGTSMLIPNATRVTPEQRNLINAAKLGMADHSRINVDMPRTRAKSVPVVNNTPKRPLISDMTKNPGLVPRTPVPIRELSGDTPGINRVSVPTAAERFASQPAARPDRAVEGMLPGRVEDTTLTNNLELLKAEVGINMPKGTPKYMQDKVTPEGYFTEGRYKDDAYPKNFTAKADIPGTNIKAGDKVALIKGRDGRFDAILDKSYKEASTGYTISRETFVDPGMFTPSTAPAQKPTSNFSDAPKAIKQINVREVRSIPVDDMSSMPDPVRESIKVADQSQAAPNKVNVPVTKNASDAALPADAQEVLANPRKFNKRQVAAAQNQRKLARQMAKTKEQTAEAIGRIDAASPQKQTAEGFVPTGEFGKSVNGGPYQKVSRASEMQAAVAETANLSPAEVIRQASETAKQNGGGYNRRDIRNIAALFETKRIQRGTPEWDAARQILKEDGTNWGQTGALRNYKIRRDASANELISRFESKIYRLADDPSKVDSKLFDEVDAAETAFVDARDAATQAYNRFTESQTSANAKAYHAAQDAADKADMNAKQVEYMVAQKALKGNKDIQQVRELEKMAQEADMYQMDAVDAAMLSGTGTFSRNFTNASISSIVEEGLLGKGSSRIASKITGQNVGGGGFIKGFKKGAVNVVDASKARYSAAGKNPLEHLKNWATTGNQLGDALIDGQTQRNTLDHYTQLLKEQGYKGRELRDRASVMARQDPYDVSETYQAAARTAAGLGAGITKEGRWKLESDMKNAISDAISGGKPTQLSENVGKLVTRITIGFPTAIGRTAAEGAKRTPFLGQIIDGVKIARTQNPQTRAVLIKEAIKHAGSGFAIIPGIFYGLGASGAITGGYPEDQAERDRWEREGIKENSIKIGDDYYQLPAYLGSWAIPALFYASLGRNNGDFGAAVADMKTVIPSLLPTDQMTNLTDFINGRADPGKWMAQTVASAVRAATPAGALLNQLAKSFDPTKNDTNTGDVTADIVSKIMSGVPGLSNMVADETDSEGNVLRNPNPFALGLGAASTSQEAGVAKTQELNDQTNRVIDNMASYGAFSDPNLKAVISDTETLKIYNDIVNGKQVNPEDLKKVQEAMVKGVSEKGTDTAYLEREQYDSNLTALQIKRELMAADPTQKPSDLKAMDVAIKRGEIYRDNEVPYELIDMYNNDEDGNSVGVEEWRKMGDPESEDYNPELYQKLWELDEMMARAGVSYGKGGGDKQKYYAKKAGSGSGGRGRGGRGGGGGGGSKISTDFGTLKTPIGAPSVQAYDGIESRNVTVPIIQKQRPNIVHKIEVLR